MPVAAWKLWERPRRVVAYVLVVVLVVVLLTVVALWLWPVTSPDLARAVVIWVCAAIYIEATRPIERLRERENRTPYTDLNLMWTYSAVLLVHPVLMAVIVSANYSHRWLRVSHHVVHRQTFSAAATVLAGYAAFGVLTAADHHPAMAGSPRDVATYLMIMAAGFVHIAVSTALVSGAIALSTPPATFAKVVAADRGSALEFAGMGLGILVAWALTDWPVALTAVFAIPLALHRTVLVQQLRKAARTDPKTGLLNLSAWRAAAAQRMADADAAGVLMIDIDHFKVVNDAHGHMFGDDVLVAVADAVTHEVRANDIVGRFGGEEFVVLLVNTTEHETLTVAERIRGRVGDMPVYVPPANSKPSTTIRVTCSVGVAIHPLHGDDLGQVVQAADDALYAAKRSGRNQVRLASASG
nr:diguanylate cyclase/phosphodiesterase (GGDEF & EAL domains) with PAS/PAC sensor(s) [Kibdelosporangium sp. MJ126-NF4]CTQ91082.1 diguanylate cyclase/phosphodiesterase (GGDEF & EAL domains) with PAS/PAC sensor(s) [Kibdelosporangium sp. MJ126-NF4]